VCNYYYYYYYYYYLFFFFFFFFFFYMARSICPRCTTAYRLIVRP
jgi:hypothetical protein